MIYYEAENGPSSTVVICSGFLLFISWYSNKKGLFFSFGCCFRDSVIISDKKQTYYNKMVETNENTGMSDFGSFTILSPYRAIEIFVELPAKKKNLKINLTPITESVFINILFDLERLKYTKDKKPIRGE